MMNRTLMIAAAGLVLAAFAGSARADYLDPWGGYALSPGYRHFLNSPSNFRTYSRLSPGYAVEGYTPYGFERFERGPGYLHQEITPYGFSSYQVVPGSRRIVIPPVFPYPPPLPSPYGPPLWP
jgi:hypothetical protein